LIEKKSPLHVIGRILAYVAVILAVIIALFPIAWIVLTSFKKPIHANAIPPVFIFKPVIDSYITLFVRGEDLLGLDVMRHLRNSFIVATSTTFITVMVALLGAYSLSRFPFKGRSVIAFGILSVRMLPAVATVIPLFLFMGSLGLIDNVLSLILAYSAIFLPFTVWMLRGFIDEIPTELEDSARIDGCSRLGALWRVVLPLVMPGVGATSIFAFMLAWNDFVLALVLTNIKARTMPLLVLAFFTDEGIYWGPMTACATVLVIPPLIMAIFSLRYLAKGLTMGAVKG